MSWTRSGYFVRDFFPRVFLQWVYRKRLLSLESPVTLSNIQKADWSVVHAVEKAGFKTRHMCTTLVKCIRNLFICQVNKTCPLDNKHEDVLLQDSLARLRKSLAVQRGQHIDVSALYSDRYAEQSAFKDPSCPKCDKKRSQFSEGSNRSKMFEHHCKKCKTKKKWETDQLTEQITNYVNYVSWSGILVSIARVDCRY